MKASDLMSSPLVFVRTRDSVGDVMGVFSRYGITGAPVLDSLGKPVGVVTHSDLVRYDRERLDAVRARALAASARELVAHKAGFELEPGNEPIEAWITPGIHSVWEDAPPAKVIKEMFRRRVHRLFVAERSSGKLLGVITAMDILRRLSGSSPRKSVSRNVALSGGEADKPMKNKGLKKIGRRGLGAVGALLCAGLSWGQVSFEPRGSLRLEGDSTLHAFQSTATKIAVSFQLADGAPALPEAIKNGQVKGLDVKISVAGLKSGESGLDKNMRAALKADKFPEILYRLGHYELVKSSAGASVSAKTTGALTVSGQTKPVTIDVEFRFGPEGASVKGGYALKMSDYGIKPPTLLLGAIKVRDPVTIRFDLLLKPRDAGKKPEREDATKTKKGEKQ